MAENGMLYNTSSTFSLSLIPALWFTSDSCRKMEFKTIHTMKEVDSTPIPGWYFPRESELISRLGGPKAQKFMSDDTCHFDRDEVGKTKPQVSIEKAEVKRKKGYVCINASYSQHPKLPSKTPCR
jgi:hypothetical protein